MEAEAGASGCFKEFMMRAASLQDLQRSSRQMLLIFQENLDSFHRPSVEEGSSLLKEVFKRNQSKRLTRYIEAGCRHLSRDKNITTGLSSSIQVLENHVKKVRKCLEGLEEMLDASMSMLPSIHNLPQGENSEDDTKLYNKAEEAANWITTMGLVFSMFQQDYEMQARIVDDLRLDMRLEILQNYCTIWDLRPFIDEEVLEGAFHGNELFVGGLVMCSFAMECTSKMHMGVLERKILGSKHWYTNTTVPKVLNSRSSFITQKHDGLNICYKRKSFCRSPLTSFRLREDLTCKAQLISEESVEWTITTTKPALPLINSERFKVAVTVAWAMGLCNAVRVIMSVAIVPLSDAHNWSSGFAGIVQSSFLWGYLFSPIPGGALADKYGGKCILGWGVLFWSLATLSTPWAANRSLTLLLAVRAVMGLAEGVAMPSMNNIVSRWFPDSERAKAVAIAMGGFHLGNVCGLLLTPLFMARFGLDGPFYAFGIVGIIWLTIWYRYIYKDPQSHPSINSHEVSYIQNGIISRKRVFKKSGLPPFGLLLSKLPCWAIIIANFVNNWGYFIILSWMPVYFNTVLGVNLKQAAWFSAVPWATMAIAGYVAGAWSDLMISSGMRVSTVRKIMQSIGFMGPAIALLGLNGTRNPAVASMWLTAAVALSSFSQAGFLVNYQEIAPNYAGVLHGISNTAGTLAAIISTIGTGYLVQRFGSFQSVLFLTSTMYFFSTLFWNSFASGRKILD